MIKGPNSTLLLEFGIVSGGLRTKASFKDLTMNEVLASLDIFSELIEEVAKDPSFSRKKFDINQCKNELIKIKSQFVSLNSKGLNQVITGKEKNNFITNLEKWTRLLHELESNYLFSTLSEDSLSKLFSDQLVSKCGMEDFEDIKDGAWCIIYGYPTPAAMILFRAAERESRKYYTRITGDSHTNKNWNTLIEDMKKMEKVPAPLLGYMDFIRSKRNEASHPDKRYTQEEAESVLQHLSSMLIEIYR